MSWIKQNIVKLAPGILLALAIAAGSIWLHGLYTPLGAVAIAMVVGLMIRNIFKMPDMCLAGASFMVKRVLRLAIILLGARLCFSEVLAIGSRALMIVIICITLAILLVAYISRLIKLPPRLGSLIGVGTAICGNSAIVATAPVIKAKDEETAFAVATITLFGVMAVLVYPLVGHLLGMTDSTFGLWAGTAINDTSQVVSAAFIYSEPAGKVATVVKLTRNLFMAPVIVIMGIIYNRAQAGSGKSLTSSVRKALPLFVLGFVAMAVLRTLGVF